MRIRLAIRYTLITGCVLLVIMFTNAYFHITKVQEIFAEASIQDADALADLILRNSYHLMMEEVGESKRVDRARILGREGVFRLMSVFLFNTAYL